MKITHTISAIALTAAITLGGTAAAFAGTDGGGGSDGSTAKADRIAAICDHRDEIVPRLTERQTNVTERIARLTELQTKATAASRTKVADRIAKRITALQAKLDTIDTRITKAPAWIAEHCS